MSIQIIFFIMHHLKNDNNALIRLNKAIKVNLIRMGIYQLGKPCDFSTARS